MDDTMDRKVSAQFQEPPVAEIPTAPTSNGARTDSEADLAAQFQEPLSPQATAPDTDPSSTSNTLEKSTTDKLKDAVKKPFQHTTSSSNTSDSRGSLGNRSITSPEMAAANKVLADKGLKSP